MQLSDKDYKNLRNWASGPVVVELKFFRTFGYIGKYSEFTNELASFGRFMRILIAGGSADYDSFVTKTRACLVLVCY